MKHPTSRKLMIARSVDLGNGYTKFTRSGIQDEQSLSYDYMSFPSFASRMAGDLSIEDTVGLKRLDVVSVEVNGLMYRVGPDALDAAGPDASRLLTESFYTSSEYLALFRGALAYMQLPQGAETIHMLGFGLPLTVFSNAELKASVLSKIRGTHPVPDILNGGVRQITVEKVALQPQLVGSLVALAFEHDLMERVLNGTNLIIDVGYGTLLWLVTNGLKPQVGRSSGNKGGVSSLLKAWLNSFNPRLANNPMVLSRLDQSLVERFDTVKIDGGEVRIDQCRNAIDEQIAVNLRELEANVGNLASIDNIFLVGGGGFLYLDAVEAHCKGRKVWTSDRDPQSSNLTGYQLTAEEQLEKIRAAA